jgi:hypothetical protein
VVLLAVVGTTLFRWSIGRGVPELRASNLNSIGVGANGQAIPSRPAAPAKAAPVELAGEDARIVEMQNLPARAERGGQNRAPSARRPARKPRTEPEPSPAPRPSTPVETSAPDLPESVLDEQK